MGDRKGGPGPTVAQVLAVGSKGNDQPKGGKGQHDERQDIFTNRVLKLHHARAGVATMCRCCCCVCAKWLPVGRWNNKGDKGWPGRGVGK